MNNPFAPKHITIASLDDGKLVQYDMASRITTGFGEYLDCYDFIGQGIIYSVNDVKQKFVHSNPDRVMNFWKSK